MGWLAMARTKDRSFVSRCLSVARKKFYEEQKEHGLLTNCLSFGTILTMAEFTQQTLSRRFNRKAGLPVPAYDWLSMARYAIMGAAVISPILYNYYAWLDNTFPGTAWQLVIKKLLVDVLLANVAYYSIFYYGMDFLEHQDHNRAVATVTKNLEPTYMAGIVFWVPVMAANFLWISPQGRVLYIAVATFVEMNGLCFMRKRAAKT